MEQEHRITYKAGITRTPSDFLCSDGELAECINLTTDNEELKPIVQPAEFISRAEQSGADVPIPKIVYIHKFGDQERYIGSYIENNETVFWWGNRTVVSDEGVLNMQFSLKGKDGYTYRTTKETQFTSIGKTLILSNEDGIMYYLWQKDSLNQDNYKNIGDIPDPQFEFAMVEGDYANGEVIESLGATEGIIEEVSNLSIRDQEKYNDLIIGLYSENMTKVARKKVFCKPFFVRTAVEMYDGKYTHISQPVLMFPAVYENSYALFDRATDNLKVYTRYCKLYFCQRNNTLEDWSDVIKDITIFITDGVDMHDTLGDQSIVLNDSTGTRVWMDNISRDSNNRHVYKRNDVIGSTANHTTTYQALTLKSKTDYEKDIMAESLFYKLCDVGLKQIITFKDVANFISGHILENIRNQTRLGDDYFSRSPLIAETVYSYNGRLNLAGVKRKAFDGFDFFMPFDHPSGTTYTYNFYVTIKTETDTVTVKHTKTLCDQKQGFYFFYPDQRATKVVIKRSDNQYVCDANLTEHPSLNGAYYFRGIPVDNNQGMNEVTQSSAIGPSTESADLTEVIPNCIVTSEVYNPWLFPKDGYNRVSVGKILSVSTTTMALSQDQFGKTDLIVFTDNGIWGMQLDKEGFYENINTVSRDVLLNKNSVTQTDGAVFFVTKKGLMVITENGVKCVSEQMNGKTFSTAVLPGLTPTDLADQTSAVEPWASIISNCQDSDTFLNFIRRDNVRIAYDYIDSRLIISSSSYSYAFIYSLADGSISKVILPATITNVLNNYPDYLIQGEVTRRSGNTVTIRNVVFSLYGKEREEEVTTRQTAFLLTRPMKLAGPVSQASLRQLKNVGTWDDTVDENDQNPDPSMVKTGIWLSSDMKTWYSDISRFGAAARYYRLALYIKMLPTERLSGTIITSQERRGKNMR